MAPTVYPREDTSREWSYCVLCGYSPTLHASQVIHICWLFFLDVLITCQPFPVDLAAPYHFHIQCKGLHFVVGFWCFDLYLVSSLGCIWGVVCCRYSFQWFIGLDRAQIN